MAEPGFAYINTAVDCVPVAIDGPEDRDALVSMKGNKPAIWLWLAAQANVGEMPDYHDITHVHVELDDVASDALVAGNNTIDVWAK